MPTCSLTLSNDIESVGNIYKMQDLEFRIFLTLRSLVFCLKTSKSNSLICGFSNNFLSLLKSKREKLNTFRKRNARLSIIVYSLSNRVRRVNPVSCNSNVVKFSTILFWKDTIRKRGFEKFGFLGDIATSRRRRIFFYDLGEF